MFHSSEVLAYCSPPVTAFKSMMQLMYVVQHLGEALTQEEANQLADELDPNKTGEVVYEDYVRILTGQSTALNPKVS